MWLKRFVLMNEADAGEGGTSAPPPASAEPAEPSTEDSVNWAGMGEELLADDEVVDVEGDLEVVEPAAPEPEAVPKPAPVVAPQTPPAAVEPPPQPAPVAPPPPAPEPAATASPEEYQTWRQTRLGQLEQMYAVSEDDATALLTEPEKVLPRIAAQVHMEVLENSMRAMQAMMPVMMRELTVHTERNNAAKSLFTSINPDLADPKFEPAIMQLGQVYRQVNPTANAEEASRAIGNLVRSALGIAVAAPVAPAAPQPVAPVPFTPARGGGSGAAPVAVVNDFEKLAMEFLQDD